MTEGAYDDPYEDRLFDHEYDGIQEYDNPMPGWWVLVFWGTILFCFPYLAWYHVGVGPSIHDDYEAELAAYAQQLLETYGELEPDEATMLRFMDDDIAMTGMASLFKSKCAQCHLADGSGNVGPNLTDDHGINIKTMTDIYTTISDGVIAKGMPEWKGKLTDTEIVLLSAYVARLRRNPLPGKAPQGDPIAPWPEAPPPP
ncbi:MAG: cbb3-type cytochrome c oxidase N-terminal domain-containing protein [Planctomycetota bacterium]|jgi:cytochrome c oxidase cbb3-type subunit 3